MTTTDINPGQQPGLHPGLRTGGRYERRQDWDDASGTGGFRGFLARSEAWLDERGRFAWIGAMVLGFVFAWPVGLFLLFYIIWSNRMFSCNKSARWARSSGRGMMANARAATRPSGNATFDAYKAATLRRLEDEQGSFEAFLGRLREAKDKAEFDQFMDDRAEAARSTGSEATSEAEREADEARDEAAARRASDWNDGPMRPAR